MRQYIKNVTFKTFQIGLLSIRYSLFSLYLGMPCAHETHISVTAAAKGHRISYDKNILSISEFSQIFSLLLEAFQNLKSKWVEESNQLQSQHIHWS